MGTIVGVGTSALTGTTLQLTDLTINTYGTMLTAKFPLKIDAFAIDYQIFLTEDTLKYTPQSHYQISTDKHYVNFPIENKFLLQDIPLITSTGNVVMTDTNLQKIITLNNLQNNNSTVTNNNQNNSLYPSNIICAYIKTNPTLQYLYIHFDKELDSISDFQNLEIYSTDDVLIATQSSYEIQTDQSWLKVTLASYVPPSVYKTIDCKLSYPVDDEPITFKDLSTQQIFENTYIANLSKF